MTIGMEINGSLELDLLDLNNNLITSDSEQGKDILDKLRKGEYFISLADRNVSKYVEDQGFVVIATFELSVGDDTEYEFTEDLNEEVYGDD